jgi:hypothetical protein
MAPLFPHIFVCRTSSYATRLTDSKPSAISTVLYTLNFLLRPVTDETTEPFIQNYRGNFVLYHICPRISLSFHILKNFRHRKNLRMRFNASFRCLPKRNNSVIPWYGGTCESNAKHHHSGHPEEENVVARLHQIQGEKSTADKKKDK